MQMLWWLPWGWDAVVNKDPLSCMEVSWPAALPIPAVEQSLPPNQSGYQKWSMACAKSWTVPRKCSGKYWLAWTKTRSERLSHPTVQSIRIQCQGTFPDTMLFESIDVALGSEASKTKTWNFSCLPQNATFLPINLPQSFTQSLFFYLFTFFGPAHSCIFLYKFLYKLN